MEDILLNRGDSGWLDVLKWVDGGFCVVFFW
jgi:hypothetical protein